MIVRLHAAFAVLALFVASCGHATADTEAKVPVVQPATGIKRETVKLTSPAGEGAGYLALPTTGDKHPAIVVIQEWWGLDDWIKQEADRLASQGYVALAVDLYRGKVARSADEAHELMRGLPTDRGVGDLEAGVAFLAARPDVDAQKIGVVGWCMGGGYALDLAIVDPRLRAAVVNYGHLATDKEKMRGIQAALLGNFGGTDRGIPADSVKQFEADMKALGKDIDFKVYDHAGHAFMNPNNTKGYDETAAKDAWQRIDDFFARTLRGS